MQNNMGFFRRLLYRFSDFMQGRYGMDGLYIPILIASCAFTLAGTLFHLGILRLIGTALLVWLVFRTFSRNYSARQKELYAYYNLKNKISSLFHKNPFANTKRKDKRYFKCPNCKVKLSVPKGKGKIQITCVKCGHQFIKKT